MKYKFNINSQIKMALKITGFSLISVFVDFSTKQILERKCFLGKMFSKRNFLPSIRLKKVNQRRQISKVVYFLKLVVTFRLTHKSIHRYVFHTQHILKKIYSRNLRQLTNFWHSQTQTIFRHL